MNQTIHIVGGGLAGVEAAYQVAKLGGKVKLYEMKPHKKSPAHHSDDLAELVCSNSLKGNRISNACGLLKEELRRLGSICMESAEQSKVPAGDALAVDRDKFSRYITETIKNHPNIEVISGEVTKIPDGICILATGPLTSEPLAGEIAKLLGEESLYFFDAAAPVVAKDSIDMSICYKMARYGKGTADYINCPFTKEQYEAFYRELINARLAPLHLEEEKKIKVFEGCMPVEVMAKRGEKTLLFGPMKPVGLPDPVTGKEYYAVVQLRQENTEDTMYNLVGFQTNLTFGEQKRVFSMIPGLQNAEFLRYGVMHRNTYINAPKNLLPTNQLKEHKNIFLAGQMTGVEGYVESMASGLLAGVNAYLYAGGKELLTFPKETALGALLSYITDETIENFQPMNMNFGILPKLNERIRSKQERYEKIAGIALEKLNEFIEANQILKGEQ
ncbi:MAG: methylenetetrahydrofolate--tRNA-(uracil(54)-C(5))-methyltransferase (FADH(2)-oxidizing) TrmFO [Clostridia bacterium]|nr:methylenetetrahydrofolate--tRNA-(uracil(54)-C(5))-methyltransferase (FADH(2)-oxidizing) TrmFO [Clostridia bacterium]